MPVSANDILYEVKGKTAIITLNLPKIFNALDIDGYYYLNRLVQQAGKEPNTTITLIQSTGTFFSAGANVKASSNGMGADIPEGTSDEDAFYLQQKHFETTFGIRNYTLTETFLTHPKVLVAALNGPVIGLSAALVSLCDFIYALDTTYLLTPFANLGLVAEGAASYTLVQRLGLSKANEALLASRPIRANDLKDRGFVNELYPASKFSSVEAFNAHVQKAVAGQFDHLVQESIIDIKKLIRMQWQLPLQQANYQEVLGGVQKFVTGVPQSRFLSIATKTRRHKL